MLTSSTAVLPNADPPGSQPNAIFDYETYVVTPADGADLPSGVIGAGGLAAPGTRPTKGIKVTGAGNVSVNLFGGGTAVLTGLSAGQILFVAVTRILATGTTATGIFALY